MYTIEEIEKYLRKQKDLESAIKNLSDESIVEVNPVNYRLGFMRTDENLKRYEIEIGMARLKEEQKTLYYRSNHQEGKYWLACNPRWRKEKDNIDTEYEIWYWVNYGDDETFGVFTVEQIREWLSTPGLKLYTLGGTRERVCK